MPSEVVFRKINEHNMLKQRLSLNGNANNKESTTTAPTKQTIKKTSKQKISY